MNIGIDIDGVLTDMEREVTDYATKMCVEEGLPIEVDVSKYYETDSFNWTQEQSYRFWNKYLVPYVVESNARKYSKEIIEKLRKEGNKIYIITARDESGMPEEYYGKMQQLTKRWLDKNEIKYDRLIFSTDKEKLQKCIENNVDIMIEDSPSNIQNISTKIKVIKFDCQYNKQILGANVVTAYSWYHIYDIIEKVNKEKGE